jgi:hypothetical protein
MVPQSLSASLSRRGWASSRTSNVGLNESRDKDFSPIKWQRSSRRTDERVEIRTTSYTIRMGNNPWRRMNYKLANGIKICKRNKEYYHIIIFSQRTSKFTSRKRRTSEHHSDGNFNGVSFHKYGPAYKHHTYQSIKLI